nr:RNA-directed DNA polymerase, eukaryota, reverse transcriptase zinc-binding domain protein [Tanacetum cinerariifolium]
GEGSATPTKPHHTTSPQEQHSPHHDPSSPSHPTVTTKTISQTPTETPTATPTLRRYTRRAIQIAQSKALSPTADESASLLRDDRQGEAFPTVSSLDARQDRENITKTSALPHESSPRVTSLDTNEGNLEISGLKARVKFLEDKDRGSAKPTQEDAPIKRGIMETREEVRADKSTELGSNDTDEMVNVLSFMEAANILTSGVAVVSVSPIAGISTVGVPTVSGLFPLLHLQEYEQAEAELTVGEKIELINELVKYQDHHAKILKYQAQQSNPLSKKEQREFYMSVFRSHAGWKTRHFKGMTLEEIKEKLILVWKQFEDFVTMSSKKEGERATKDKEKELWVELKRLFELDFVDQLWTHNQAFMHDPLEWKFGDRAPGPDGFSFKASILVNGSPTKEFSLKRGPRQGDPLSPFLFIIAIEGLHVAMDSTMDHGLFQGISIGSNLHGVSVTSHEVSRLADITGYAASRIPFRYLRLPVGSNMGRGGVNDRKIPWVKWDSILNERDKGGLGISSLKASNLALLYKWRWRFMNDHDSIWVKVIKSIHGRDGGFGTFDWNPVGNGVWATIVKVVDQMHEKQIIPLNSVALQLGNGHNVSFWNAIWVGEHRLRDKFPWEFDTESNKECSIAERWVQD